MSDRTKFHGLCLEAVDGHEMMPVFDDAPRSVQERLRRSPFNICTQCVINLARDNGYDYERAISYFEDAIRASDQEVREKERVNEEV